MDSAMDPAVDNEDFQKEEFYTKYEPLELLGKLVFLLPLAVTARDVLVTIEVCQVQLESVYQEKQGKNMLLKLLTGQLKIIYLILLKLK